MERGGALVVGIHCQVFMIGRKKLRSMLWKVRAEVRRQMKKQKQKQIKHNLSFHYDPLSYALNFDDGHCGFFFC